MINVMLYQLDGKMPNMALMRIASHHRRRGDMVELRHLRNKAGRVNPTLWDQPDLVYASTIFTKTAPVTRSLLQQYPNAIVGGTGWDASVKLSDFGISETESLDYSDYPSCQFSMGFTQRGCRLSCEFCVVPKKEGKVSSVATIHDLWRGEPYPKHILLMDNDFFGNPDWKDRIKEIQEGRFKVSFNQGINARMISREAAEAIASVDYRDDSFTTKRIYTAWDNKPDEAVLFRGLNHLKDAGVKPDHVMVYMLIGYWAGETETDWLYRWEKLTHWGARPYPMPYRRNSLTVGFQRWVVGSYHKRVSWSEFKQSKCRPEKLGKVSLPLFEG